MHIVVLSYPEELDYPRAWKALDALGPLSRYRSSTLPQFLERSRHADVLVTTSFPLRRELLDYATRPKVILTPSELLESLVEVPIADQLGITILGVPGDPSDGSDWIEEAARVLAKHMQLPDRQD